MSLNTQHLDISLAFSLFQIFQEDLEEKIHVSPREPSSLHILFESIQQPLAYALEYHFVTHLFLRILHLYPHEKHCDLHDSLHNSQHLQIDHDQFHVKHQASAR